MTPHLLITRPEPDASLLAAHCVAMGCEAIISPVMQIESALPCPIPPHTVIVATSPHALQPWVMPHLAPHARCHVVGARAGKAFSAHGFVVESQHEDAEGLLQHLLHTLSAHESLLYLTGEHITHDLLPALHKRGTEAQRVTTYHAKAASALADSALLALQSPAPPTVFFASARSVRLFCELLPASVSPSHLVAVCLSASIAKEAEAHGFGRCFSQAATTSKRVVEAYLRQATGMQSLPSRNDCATE